MILDTTESSTMTETYEIKFNLALNKFTFLRSYSKNYRRKITNLDLESNQMSIQGRQLFLQFRSSISVFTCKLILVF